MANKKISALTGATIPLDGTEVLPIVQGSATVKVANNDLRPKQIQSNATSGVLQIAGPGTVATRVMTTPDANFTVARIDAAQSFTGDQTLSTGNLIQGTAAKGVNFTANTPAAGMTSQLLNWYEEGTWTPTDASGAGLTMTINYAKYTRVGNQVTINMFITYPVTANASNINIGGLPFAVAANNYAPATMSTNSGFSTVAEFAATTTTFYVVDPTNVGIFRINANLSGSNVILAGMYFI